MSKGLSRGIIIGGLFLFSLAVLFPSFFPEKTPDSYPFSKIRLGLDLRGGSYLIMGVKTEEAITGYLSTLATNLRTELRDKRIGLLRARQVDGYRLELQLISSQAVEDLKTFMQESYPDLRFDEQRSVDPGLADSSSNSQILVWYSLTERDQLELRRNSVVQAIETIRNRVDQFGVAEPTIQRSGEDRLMVQLPDITNVEDVKKTLGSVAKLEFRLVANKDTPSGRIRSFPTKEGGVLNLEEEVLLTGDAVSKASVEIDPQTNETVVALKFNSYGAKTFERITGDNKDRALAIILDGRIQSYPNIKSRISGGRAQITGGFTKEEARQLQVVLNSGALPATLTFEEERTVGATLGADSIRKGVMACIIGLGIVVLFILVYYKRSGVLAVGCLVLNILLLLAGLSLLGATLTLPGLAGLALTVGMAVDANVIIFERIKEELRSGSSTISAITHGFERAHLTILDSNLTTLLTGIVLYLFGTGPIKGFAVTLSIGIVSSMFVALYVCRAGFEVISALRKGRDGALSI
ncbi:MAG TPA: protein translocase subunit SecD [Oligoflexia bacterium]|nr:protein translocase subunit SecD [Oligoflexia bacterium]HMP49827.1 protein translocase subunit SecD [Oligoflexia bacterium]